VPDLTGRWFPLDWHDPFVVGLVALILVVAFWRRWSLVLLAALLVALGQGLDYLLRHAAIAPGLAQNAVAAIYLLGIVLLAFLAIAGLVSKR
jgi:hypothetical protein